MDLFGVLVCALCAVAFGALIKKSNKEYALLLAAGAAVLILLFVMEQLGPLISQMEALSGEAAFGGDCLAVMLKAVGIALAGQFAANVCKDAGESALAWAVDLAAKVAILACAMPLLTRLFAYLEEIVTL